MNHITDRLVKALKNELTKSRYIDVSSGCEKFMCISKGRLNTALNLLIQEGYSVVSLKERGPGKPTIRILCRKDDASFKDILKQRKILTGKKKEAPNE